MIDHAMHTCNALSTNSSVPAPFDFTKETLEIDASPAGAPRSQLFAVLTRALIYSLVCPLMVMADPGVQNSPTPEIFSYEFISDSEGSMVMEDEIISEELMLFQELPMVVSAARREQPINQSSVPISVVTTEDIQYGGLTNLYEILQFQPGVDMLQIDRNRYALGVRGLHEFFSDRTLTLIDGRNADSPVFGGSEFLRLPLFVEDIERVEVVRGPGGAAWGAQAFNGVINIITKDPRDVHGSMISGTINEFGDYTSLIRWADGTDQWDWRLSLGYTEWESSDEAIDADINLLSGEVVSARDFHRNIRFDSKAIYRMTDDSNLSLGLGISDIEHGSFEATGSIVDNNSQLTTIRGYTRVDHAFANDTSGYLQWFGNFAKTEWPGLQTNDSLENDVEAQYNFTFKESHSMTIGGNIRFVRITTDQKSEEDVVFKDEPLNEEWAGLFVSDRWQAAKRLVLETQIRGDYYSETHPDWSGRVTSLYSVDNENRHVLRLSGARAFRAPLAALREIENARSPIPFIPPTISIIPPEDLDNEGIISIELGYSGQISRFIVLNLNSYYQHYEDLIGFTRIAQTDFLTPFGLVPSTVWTLDNIDNAEALGIELELAMTANFGRLSLWYTYNEFDPDRSNQAVRAFLPAKNKVGMTGRLYLPWNSALNLSYKYTDTTPNNPGSPQNVAIPDLFEISHRLDITVTKQFFGDRFEWLIGVSDLFDETDIQVVGINNFSAHETPGRIIFTRLSLNF